MTGLVKKIKQWEFDWKGRHWHIKIFKGTYSQRNGLSVGTNSSVSGKRESKSERKVIRRRKLCSVCSKYYLILPEEFEWVVLEWHGGNYSSKSHHWLTLGQKFWHQFGSCLLLEAHSDWLLPFISTSGWIRCSSLMLHNSLQINYQFITVYRNVLFPFLSFPNRT